MTGGVAWFSAPVSGKSRRIFWACSIAPARAAAEPSDWAFCASANQGAPASEVVNNSRARIGLRKVKAGFFVNFDWLAVTRHRRGNSSLTLGSELSPREAESQFSAGISLSCAHILASLPSRQESGNMM
jgi:hypothetical protein